MRSRLMLTMVAILIGVFSISSFLGKAEPASASSLEPAIFSFNNHLPLIESSSETIPSTYTLYLPLVLKNFPLQTIFGAEMRNLTSAGGMDQMAAANISWTRRNGVLWSSVESNEGTYDWSSMANLESELQNASSKGIQVILIVRSTPQWARKIAGTGPYCGPIHPNKLVAFGNFMRDLVARYSVPPYNIKYWELWNEPDIDPPSYFPADSVYGCWGDQSDAFYGGRYYAEMLKAAYPQIKAADPQAQVLIGGLLLNCDPTPGAGCDNPTPAKFLEGILLNNGGPYFDGVSFHGYDYYSLQLGKYSNSNWQSAWNTTGPVLIAKSQFIKRLLSQYGISGKFLMNTESAILCDACSNDPAFETTKDNYVAQAYAAALAQGLRANIWFSVLGWRNSALLDSNLTPRLAYTALQFSRNELRDAAWVRDVTGYSGVKGYEFQRGDRRIWIIWSLDGDTHLVNLPGVPLAVWDAMGNPVSPVLSMDISMNPIYLEWNP